MLGTGSERGGSVWRSVGLHLILLTTLAIAVRIPGIASRRLSGDEAFSWRLTQYPSSEIILRTGADVHPPPYYLILQGWTFCWGSSLEALRGLSVLFGTCAVFMTWLVVREVSDRKTAFFCMALMAIHSFQVELSQVARMYGMGVFFALLTAWLLLRALRASHWGSFWWTAYGLAVTAFCFVHYYAMFTVAAQTCFVVGDLVTRRRTEPGSRVAHSALGFTLAGALALLLYSPWFHVLWAQTQEVRETYWIPELTKTRVLSTFISWGMGAKDLGTVEAISWCGFVLGSILWLVWCGDRGGWFFLCLGGLPWLFAWGSSLGLGRSIFLGRYLAFGQMFFLGLLSVCWARIPQGWGQWLYGVSLVSLFAVGLGARWEQIPDRPPAVVEATLFLHQHHQPGDLVLADSPSALNRLRFYASQAGLSSLQARCWGSPLSGGGHTTHVASLSTDEFVDPSASTSSPRRIWRASESNPGSRAPLPGMSKVLGRRFDGGGTTHYVLILYEATSRERETESEAP